MKAKSKQGSLNQAIQEALSGIGEWVTIEAAIDACNESGAFAHIPADELIREAKAHLVRRALRQSGRMFPGEDGSAVEWVNLTVINKDRKKENRYKQLSLFTKADFIQVIRDRQRRTTYFTAEVKRFAELAVAKYGESFRQMLLEI